MRHERSEHNGREEGRQRQTEGNATSTRTNEEHVKEFEGLSETMMKAAGMVNVMLVSREYPMIALSYIAFACVYLYLLFRLLLLFLFLRSFFCSRISLL